MRPMKARELFELALQNGWAFEHATGSHHIYRKPGHASLSIPGPATREVKAPTAAAIVKRIKEGS